MKFTLVFAVFVMFVGAMMAAPFDPSCCVCPLNYDPVCGCDGVTYSNMCFLNCAGVELDYCGPCC